MYLIFFGNIEFSLLPVVNYYTPNQPVDHGMNKTWMKWKQSLYIDVSLDSCTVWQRIMMHCQLIIRFDLEPVALSIFLLMSEHFVSRSSRFFSICFNDCCKSSTRPASTNLVFFSFFRTRWNCVITLIGATWWCWWFPSNMHKGHIQQLQSSHQITFSCRYLIWVWHIGALTPWPVSYLNQND